MTDPISNATAGSSTPTGTFWSQLQQASFRDVPFVSPDDTARFGRRQAMHQYAFRDTPWPEDLGRSARRFDVVGYVVGDDAIAQRDRLIAACEAQGDGILIHPTYGRLNVSVTDFEVTGHRGRVFEFVLRCVESGGRQYPSATVNGQEAVAATAANLSSTSTVALEDATGPAIPNTAGAASQALRQAVSWVSLARSAARGSTNLLGLAIGLSGNFGRLLGVSDGVLVGELASVSQAASLIELAGQGVVKRAAVDTSAAQLTNSAAAIGTGDVSSIATAAQGLASAVHAAATTPGQALAALAPLATFAPDGVAAGDELVIQSAIVALFRRAAIAEMAIAAAAFDSKSADDAITARDQVLAVLDDAIDVAGDNGDDEVFSALRALRAQVVLDLNARGAALPSLKVVSVAAALPSLVLAQRFYKDATRADELVDRAVPIHPAFMPLTFKALSQ